MSIKDELQRLTGVKGHSINDVLDNVESLGGGGGGTGGFRSIEVVVNQHVESDPEQGDATIIDTSTVSGMSYSELRDLLTGETVIMSLTLNTTYPDAEEPVTGVLKCFTTKMMMNAFPSLVGLFFTYHPRDYVFYKSYRVVEFKLSGEDDLAIQNIGIEE